MSDKRSPITTHVLDTAQGHPAENVPVVLEIRTAKGEWKHVANGQTDKDGRIMDLLGANHRLEAGTYLMTFRTGDYFSRQKVKGFYPAVTVLFEITDAGQHYHIPLLLSPYGYSTYRGS